MAFSLHHRSNNIRQHNELLLRKKNKFCVELITMNNHYYADIEIVMIIKKRKNYSYAGSDNARKKLQVLLCGFIVS
jgi:hypothetical protein